MQPRQRGDPDGVVRWQAVRTRPDRKTQIGMTVAGSHEGREQGGAGGYVGGLGGTVVVDYWTA